VELRDILALLDEKPTVEALVANDLEFHRRIAVGSGNTVLASLIDSLSGPTTRARIWRGLTQEGAVERTRDQHTAICEAIASRQPEIARSWATIHIAGVEDWLRRAL
jgi:DNA-binding FadR family transcriptional regulator